MRSSLFQRVVNACLLVALPGAVCALPSTATQSATQHKTHKGSTASSTPHSAGSRATATSSAAAPAKKSSGKAPPARKSTKSSGKGSSRKSSRVKGQAAPTPDRVSEIQQALAKNGVYSDVPSGKWDDSTVQAMKKYQLAQGLNPTGKLDALTLQKLGFGSETAGLAAPTPPPNAAANRLLHGAQRDEIKSEDQPQPQ